MTQGETAFAALCAKAKELGRKLGKSEIISVLDTEFARLSKERKKATAVPSAEQVYDLYPRKIGRDAALIAITKALTKNELSYLMQKTSQFAEAVNSWPVSYRFTADGRDMCPYPATWFNDGRFADDIREWKRFGARKAAGHQHVSPPEPEGWRDAFPDFTDRDKPWNYLQPAQQAYIVANMTVTDHFTQPIQEDNNITKLRQA